MRDAESMGQGAESKQSIVNGRQSTATVKRQEASGEKSSQSKFSFQAKSDYRIILKGI